MNTKVTVDNSVLYDDYWQSASTKTTKQIDHTPLLSELIASTCGVGSAIDIGCGSGDLVRALLGKGIDTIGVDISGFIIQQANTRLPDRFIQASIQSIPFSVNFFDIVISINCLEHLSVTEIPKVLQELRRISAKHVFLQIATQPDQDNELIQTLQERSWWETKCFEAGFRKHPLYYRANPYESLNQDKEHIIILLEKVPDAALCHFDLMTLAEERLLHTDMLRETGRHSDAHCIRYHKASELIRPGDNVLDVACGLGYGSHILYQNSMAKSVIGVDLSDFGIAYANAHYGLPSAIQFNTGDAQTLDFIPDHSIDFITAFETIEHLPDPTTYLRTLKRVLKPSGRLMICAPNDWTDETGKDPNPHHLHVYTWARLVDECKKYFLLEKGFLQVAGGAMKLHHSPRRWVEVPPDQPLKQATEWVLLLCMADPVSTTDAHTPYNETSWSIPEDPAFHVSAFAKDYQNPWLVKGMVSIGMRSQNGEQLEKMQEKVLASYHCDTVDYGAALCGRIYSFLNRTAISTEEYSQIKEQIWDYAKIASPSPHQLRWQISLLFAGGKLATHRGALDDAFEFYTTCAEKDVLSYSPVLGTKTLSALRILAIMYIARHNITDARACLLKCVSEAERLTKASWLNVTGDTNAPLPFGLAELSQLLDIAAGAAYLLSTLNINNSKNGIQYQESKGFFERQLLEKNRQIEEKDRSIVEMAQEIKRLDVHSKDLVSQLIEAHKASTPTIKNIGGKLYRKLRKYINA